MSESVTQRSDPRQPGLVVDPVSSSASLSEFVEVPYRMYAGNGAWVPPLRRDERRRLDKAHNPFLEHAEMQMWLARRDGQVVGRVAAIEDRLHNDTHGEQVAWFGFLEAVDAPVTADLLRVVEQWGRSRNCRVVRGPVNPSLNESAGLLLDAFDLDPCILMPFNPPSYPRFVESSGYVKAKDLLAWEMDLAASLPERVRKIAARVAQRHGVAVRALDPREFDRDLAAIQTIYRAAWEDNWGFVPPTDAEVRQLAVDLKPIMDPALVQIAEINGRPVGCAVTIPDANQVLKRMNGRLFPFGIFHFLRRRRIMTRVRVLILGVLPEFRRIGLYPLIIAEAHRRAVARGYTRAEMSWTLEDNDADNPGIQAAGGRHYKPYRLYEKPLG